LAEVRAKKEALLATVDVDRTELMSNPQFAEQLRKLGVEPPTKVSPTTGKETYAFSKTDEEFKALLEHEDERVQALVAARLGTKSTLEETRTEALLGVGMRGALPIMLNYYGGSTGRMSGGEKMNLQNLPRGGEIRKSLIAPPGHSIVACDSGNIEGRVNAYFSGQKELIAQFRHGVDIYCDFASKVYGRPITKKDKKERFTGKTCILGLGYGTGHQKLQTTLKMQGGVIVDEQEAKRIVSIYRKTYYKIAEMWKTCSWVINQMLSGAVGSFGDSVPLRYEPERVYLPSGRFLYYPGLSYDPQTNEISYRRKQFRTRLYGAKLLENIVQALARDIVMYQMCAIDSEIKARAREANDGKVRQIVLSVHDEVVAIVPDEDVQWCTEVMERNMVRVLPWCSDIPLACESGSGLSYGEAK
jgi:DNA polymerase